MFVRYRVVELYFLNAGKKSSEVFVSLKSDFFAGIADFIAFNKYDRKIPLLLVGAFPVMYLSYLSIVTMLTSIFGYTKKKN